MAKKKDNKSKSNTQDVIMMTLQGRFLSLQFFKENFIYIIAVTIMTLMYISNKYTCQSYQQEVMNLKNDLENAKTDWVNSSAKYNSMIRESHMKAYIDTMHIDLSSPEQPPYHMQTK